MVLAYSNGGTYTVKKNLSVFLFIFLSALAFGELSIEEKIEGRNRPSNIVLEVKADEENS